MAVGEVGEEVVGAEGHWLRVVVVVAVAAAAADH